MTWRDALRTATFRGVPFYVDEASARFGRRIVAHEYPQRDDPYHEDLGRARRTFTVRGFVGGTGLDYRSARDALIRAIETPGPGELVHPTFGELSVVVLSCDSSESTRDGGIWRFTVTFAEAGSLVFPEPVEDMQTASDTQADAVYTAQGADFLANWTIDDQPDWVIDDAIENVLAQRDTILEAAEGPHASTLSQMAELRAALTELDAAVNADVSRVTEPALLLADLQAIYQLLDSLPVLRALTATAGEQRSTVGTTPDVEAAEANREALDRLFARCLLAEHARALAQEELGWLERAVELRDELTDRIAAEELLGGSLDAYTALVDLRGAVVRDVAARSADLPRMRTEVVRVATPAIVIAHQLYGDAEREEEIVERNHIRHPLFAVGELEVLTS